MIKLSRVLVTGARGFIGRRLVQQLAQRGTEVVCLDRGVAREDSLGQLDVQRLTADVRDESAVGQTLARAGQLDAVFHLAACTAPRSIAEARATNVAGSANLAAAAARSARPPVFVYVSSLAVAGPNAVAATEDAPCHPVSLYGQSKLEAEQSLQQHAAGLPVTVLRPPCVFGPGDRNLLSLFRSVYRGWNVFADPVFQYSFLYVDDLVTALVAAAERGQRLASQPDASCRGVYFVADRQAVTFPELGALVASSMGRTHVRQVRVPAAIGWTAARAGQLVQRVFRRRVFFNLDKAREAYGGSWMCDPARAERQLQFYPPRSLAERLSETAGHYRQAGWLPSG